MHLYRKLVHNVQKKIIVLNAAFIYLHFLFIAILARRHYILLYCWSTRAASLNVPILSYNLSTLEYIPYTSRRLVNIIECMVRYDDFQWVTWYKIYNLFHLNDSQWKQLGYYGQVTSNIKSINRSINQSINQSINSQ